MQNSNPILVEHEKFTVLIVDDENLARKLLGEYVAKLDYLELAGNCTNAIDALTVIQKQQIDILLTDIQMPNISGIDLVSGLVTVPAIIFTTAYSEYAVESYELWVVDYLLKPITFPRFLRAIDKAVRRVQSSRYISQHHLKNQDIIISQQELQERDYIMIKADFKLYKVHYNDLIYMEGQQEYVTFHTTQRNITAYYVLKNLVLLLPASHFVRIHKSYIVSIRHIDIIENNTVQIGSLKLPIGASFKEDVMKVLI
ncbi:MAG: response regulator transcription factor [Bacteroidales bacterium]|jgi:DNA-binding LytR/AlgR family response regulator|nr:response regulator transcription factor [Bacteroidales bacterium]